MFLADVALGRTHTPKGDCRSVPSGCDSIWAKARVSGPEYRRILNDEFIVPHVHQCNLVYLLEFSPSGR